jgi:hypothetical protein
MAGCACSSCRRAIDQARRARDRMLQGLPVARRVPAEPSQRIVQRLQRRGYSLGAIADEAGLSYWTVMDISRGRHRQVLSSTERRLKGLV